MPHQYENLHQWIPLIKRVMVFSLLSAWTSCWINNRVFGHLIYVYIYILYIYLFIYLIYSCRGGDALSPCANRMKSILFIKDMLLASWVTEPWYPNNKTWSDVLARHPLDTRPLNLLPVMSPPCMRGSGPILQRVYELVIQVLYKFFIFIF